MSAPDYHEFRKRMAEALRREAAAQAAGRLEAVGAAYDIFDGALPREGGPEFDKLFLALRFWDSWADERNHGFPNFSGIAGEEWPVLARRVAQDLEEDREITDPAVRGRFALQPKQRWWRWLLNSPFREEGT